MRFVLTLMFALVYLRQRRLADNMFQLTVMKKEVLTVHMESRHIREQVVRDIQECAERSATGKFCVVCTVSVHIFWSSSAHDTHKLVTGGWGESHQLCLPWGATTISRSAKWAERRQGSITFVWARSRSRPNAERTGLLQRHSRTIPSKRSQSPAWLDVCSWLSCSLCQRRPHGANNEPTSARRLAWVAAARKGRQYAWRATRTTGTVQLSSWSGPSRSRASYAW